MISKKILISDAIWLVIFVAAVLLIDYWIFGQSSLGKRVREVQLYDTFYVIRSREWLLTLFTFIALPIFLIKEGVKGYSRFWPNVVLSGLLMIALFVFFFWHRITFQVLTGEWIVYPPITADPRLAEEVERSYNNFGNTVFFILELAIVISLFFLGIRTGRLVSNQPK